MYDHNYVESVCHNLFCCCCHSLGGERLGRYSSVFGDQGTVDFGHYGLERTWDH